MENEKKTNKYIAHATKQWEKAQVQAAGAAEALSKAIAVVEEYKHELTPLQYADVSFKFDEQKKELEKFLLQARDTYVAKMESFGLEPLTEDASKGIVVE